MRDEHKVERSSGNFFKDIGMPHAEQRLAKAELARVIRKLWPIAASRGGRRQSAEGSRSPTYRISCGEEARFSMERLERFLLALDMNVNIQIGPRASSRKTRGLDC